MKTKMTLQDLKALFQPYQPVYKSPDGLEVKIGKHAASKKGHRHTHGMSRGQRKDAAK